MITMNQIMLYATELKPLPPTVCKLAALIANEKSTVDELIAVFEFDTVLSAEVLRYANSVMSASKKRVETLKDAVIRLGAPRILERIIAGHVHGHMKQPLDAYGLLGNELWKHSVASAVAAESLGAYTGRRIAGVAFTAALLHDIGKLLIGRAIGTGDIKQLLKNADKHQNSSFESIEQFQIGYSHAQIGAQLCSLWNLPERICIAIRDHHHIRGTYNDAITDCVRLSNMTAKIIGEGVGFEGMAFIFDIECAKRFGFSTESYEAFCASVKYKFNEIVELYINETNT